MYIHLHLHRDQCAQADNPCFPQELGDSQDSVSNCDYNKEQKVNYRHMAINHKREKK